MEEVLPGAGLRKGTCRDFDGGKGDSRMFHIAGQVWVGAEGGRAEWDPRAMVVDLLQRKGGLFMIGDSITSQHFEGLTHLLLGLAITESKRLNLTSSSSNRPLFQSRNITEAGIEETKGLELPKFRGLFLRLDHPLAKGLLEEAGVTEKRARLPLAAVVRDDFLMSKEEYDEFIAKEEFSLEEGVDFATTQWKEYLERTTDASSRPTVVLLSTGPHWAKGRFSGPGQVQGLTPERLIQLYQRSIKSLFHRVRPHSSSILPIFRTTAQGHPNCQIYSKEGSHPANETELLIIQESFSPPPGISTKHLFNWPLLPTFNDILRTELDAFNLDLNRRWGEDQDGWPRGEAGEKGRGEVIWMDVTRQTLLRPDAHLSPLGGDCLHLCMPGVPEEWVRFLWELIKEDSVVY